VQQVVAALVLLYGGYLVLHGAMSRGDLVAFMLYEQNLAGTLDMLGNVYSALMSAIGAAEEVIRLLHREPRAAATGSLTRAALAGHLELRNVRFAYPSRPEARPPRAGRLHAGLPCSRRASVSRLVNLPFLIL
jgi:ABC-type bacteriocin/lantibiotic exporter with double-glycine peptidase domain